MITETSLPRWSNIKLDFKENRYPQCADKNAPRLFLNAIFCGSRGSGKSFSICRLLKMYGQYGIVDPETKVKLDQRIILLSPTADANKCWDSLKWLNPSDTIHNFSDIKLLNAIDDIKRERKETLQYQEDLAVYKRYKSKRHLTPQENLKLEMTDYQPPKACKYVNGVATFIVLDDLIGSSAFRLGKNPLISIVLKNRHLCVSLLIATQSIKSVPRSIRTNCSVFVIFKFASKKIILEDMYEEVSNCLTVDQFESILTYATKDPHDCLVIDFTQPISDRFKMNFDRVLSLT